MFPVQKTTNPQVSALERAPLVSAVQSFPQQSIKFHCVAGGGRDVNRALETLTCYHYNRQLYKILQH